MGPSALNGRVRRATRPIAFRVLGLGFRAVQGVGGLGSGFGSWGSRVFGFMVMLGSTASYSFRPIATLCFVSCLWVSLLAI